MGVLAPTEVGHLTVSLLAMIILLPEQLWEALSSRGTRMVRPELRGSTLLLTVMLLRIVTTGRSLQRREEEKS